MKSENRVRIGIAAALLAAVPALPIVLGGCLSQETTGDSTRQDCDRQNAVAAQVDALYSPIKGQYAGTYDHSTVELTLDVAHQAGSGCVGQPTLVGSLTLLPEIFVDDQGQPMTIPYMVSSGQFSGSDVTLSVQEGGSPTILHCKVGDSQSLDCHWYVSASTVPVAQFSLARVATGQPVTALGKAFGGTYTGHTADFYKIDAQFESVLVPQIATPGSVAVPLVSISGMFRFYDNQSHQDGVNDDGVPERFKDGEYDPISNTIAIIIQGSNPVPIVVNCLIKTPELLHCTWVGKYGAASDEDFDLEKTT